MNKAISGLAFMLLCDCAGSMHSQAVTVANGAADVVDAGTVAITSAYCHETMHAIGRLGELVAGHCTTADPDRAATDAELAELERVRALWRPVIAADAEVIRVHDALREALTAGESGDVFTALGHVSAAYESLRTAATAVHITLPRLP